MRIIWIVVIAEEPYLITMDAYTVISANVHTLREPLLYWKDDICFYELEKKSFFGRSIPWHKCFVFLSETTVTFF